MATQLVVNVSIFILDPETNTRPFATAITQDGTGEIEWYSGDPEDNPSRKGVEPNGQKLEGFRTIRIAYEPTKELTRWL